MNSPLTGGPATAEGGPTRADEENAGPTPVEDFTAGIIASAGETMSKLAEHRATRPMSLLRPSREARILTRSSPPASKWSPTRAAGGRARAAAAVRGPSGRPRSSSGSSMDRMGSSP
jgi:hypothetical protein